MHLCPFEGAPGPEPADITLLYLGDVEISEEATLVELKSKVRPLPEVFFGVDMASSREILINVFFYFLFPQLQSVLIWHVLYAMVRGKYQQAAHAQHRHRGICWCHCSRGFHSPSPHRHAVLVFGSVLGDLWPMFILTF